MAQLYSSGHHQGAVVKIGTVGNDILRGGRGVADLLGWAGDDTLYGGLRGGLIAGGHGDDIIYGRGFGSGRPEQYQTHAFGDWGNDTFYLDVSRHAQDHHGFRFGHHAFGGQGADKFIFSNVAGGNQRIVGRIDDFDMSQDSIWVDDVRVNFNDLPQNVRVVKHLGQQWILIDNRILYSLEGARHASATVDGDGRNAEGLEENHFIYWPSQWENGVPASADVAYQDPVNFVPARFLRQNQTFDHNFRPTGPSFSGTDKADRIEGAPDRGQTLFGRNGDDFIFGNRGDDTIHGGSGRDQLDGYHGHDRIYGGPGNDIIDGGKGHDLIWGGVGNDIIAGGSDNDTIHGGDGRDTIFGGTEDDLIYGNAGNDVLYGGPGRDRLHGGWGRDVLHGGSEADTLWGNAESDTLHGGAENDLLYGGTGNDALYGGTGHDRLFGETGRDTLYGGSGNDRLFGGPGNDAIWGGAGNDTLSGGAGADRLHGGSGADTFIFQMRHDSLPGRGRDVILDFQTGIDRIDLSRLDADMGMRGHQSLTFSAHGPADHAVWLQSDRNGVLLRVDLDGDAHQDFVIWLAGVDQMRASDILL